MISPHSIYRDRPPASASPKTESLDKIDIVQTSCALESEMTLHVIHRSSRLVRHVGSFAFHSHHRDCFLSTRLGIRLNLLHCRWSPPLRSPDQYTLQHHPISQVERYESANLGRYRGFRGITRHLGSLEVGIHGSWVVPRDGVYVRSTPYNIGIPR